MLYPSFEELLQLRHKAKQLTLMLHRKVATPLAGNYMSTFRGQGLEFEEVREYVQGDDVRNIDWRVTARTGKAHLKTFREERERSVIICVDAGSHMQFGTRGTFKSVQAARAAALLGWSAHGHNDRIGGLVVGQGKKDIQYMGPSRSRRSLWRMLKALSTAAPHHDVDMVEVLRHLRQAAPTSSLVFIISDFFNIDNEFRKQLIHLNEKCEIVLLPIYDPADGNIPAIGKIMFFNNSNVTQVNTNIGLGRKRYTEQWVNRKLDLENIARSLNIRLIELHTNQDVYDSLLQGLWHKR